MAINLGYHETLLELGHLGYLVSRARMAGDYAAAKALSAVRREYYRYFDLNYGDLEEVPDYVANARRITLPQ